MGPRLYDYQVMSELVRSLPSASERIDFVNPYERDFTLREKRFHRYVVHSFFSFFGRINIRFNNLFHS